MCLGFAFSNFSKNMYKDFNIHWLNFKYLHSKTKFENITVARCPFGELINGTKYNMLSMGTIERRTRPEEENVWGENTHAYTCTRLAPLSFPLPHKTSSSPLAHPKQSETREKTELVIDNKSLSFAHQYLISSQSLDLSQHSAVLFSQNIKSVYQSVSWTLKYI